MHNTVESQSMFAKYILPDPILYMVETVPVLFTSFYLLFYLLFLIADLFSWDNTWNIVEKNIFFFLLTRGMNEFHE